MIFRKSSFQQAAKSRFGNRLISFVLAFFCCICLGGCQQLSYLVSDQSYAQAEMQKILSALDSRDEEAFKNLFAEDSLKHMEHIDRQIDAFFQFYRGTSVRFEDLGGSNEKRMGTGRYLNFSQPYRVVTTEETYRIVFDYTAYHEEQRSQEGLHGILIMTEKLAQEAEIWQWPSEGCIDVLESLDDCYQLSKAEENG